MNQLVCLQPSTEKQHGWIAQRPGSDVFLTCMRDSDAGLVRVLAKPLSSLGTDQSVELHVFPSIPLDLFHGEAVFNQDGTALLVYGRTSAYVLFFAASHSFASENVAQFERVETDSGLNFTWIGGDQSPLRGARHWGIKLQYQGSGDVLHGNLYGDVEAQVRMKRIRQPNSTTSEWLGELQRDGELERFTFLMTEKHGQLGCIRAERLDCASLGTNLDHELCIKGACWHPLSRFQLCILDHQDCVRVYQSDLTLEFADSSISLPLESYDGHSAKASAICFIPCGPKLEISVWAQLSLFVLFEDGSVHVIGPVGNPRSLNVAEQDIKSAIDHARHGRFNVVGAQRRVFEEQLLFLGALTGEDMHTYRAPPVGVQVLCTGPRSPGTRYNKPRPGALAQDLVLTTLGKQHIVLHRVWTCGRMDLLVTNSNVLKPWWKYGRATQMVVRPDKHKDGPFANLNSKLKGVAHENSFNTFPQPDMSAEPRIVKCLELFQDFCRPFVYPVHSYPGVSAVCDLVSGEAILLRVPPHQVGFPFEMTNITVQHAPFKTRSSLCLYSDPSLGVGYLSVGKDDIFRQDLSGAMRNLRKKVDLESGGGEMGHDDPEIQRSLGEFRQNLEHQYRVFDKLQDALDMFPKSIPQQIANVKVDGSAQDESLELSAAEWLVGCFQQLTKSGTSDQNSVVSAMFQAQSSLERACEMQQKNCTAMVSSIKEIERALHELDEERMELDKTIPDYVELLVAMRKSANKCLTRSMRLQNRSLVGSSRLNETQQALREATRAAVVMSDKVSAANATRQKLQSTERNSGPETTLSPEDTSAMALVSEEVVRSFGKIDELNKTCRGIPSCATVVFLVSFANGVDERELTRREDSEKIYLDERLLSQSYQRKLRGAGAKSIPHTFNVGSLTGKVVFLPNTTRVHHVEKNTLISDPRKGEQTFQQVIPVCFSDDSQVEPSVLGWSFDLDPSALDSPDSDCDPSVVALVDKFLGSEPCFTG